MSADLAADRRPQSWSTGEREWTPGFSDWLGDRFLDFDLTTAMSLERLQFKREFSDSPVFETALRERVAELQHLQHPSLETVRGVIRVPNKGLILESKHTAGRRLSEVFPQEPGSTMAVDLIRQLVPMLSLLHKTAPGVAHGAITAERIVVTRDGRLVLTEHVLGGALAAQQMPTMRWRALGMPTDGEMALADERGDLVQLGFLALSIMLGRRLSAIDYPVNIERFVSESAMSASGRSPETAWLRRWIERALQVGPSPFTSAHEAREALTDLSDAGTEPRERATRPAPSPVPAPAPPAPVAPVIPMPRPVERAVEGRFEMRPDSRTERPEVRSEVRTEVRAKAPTLITPPAPPATPVPGPPALTQGMTPIANPMTPAPVVPPPAPPPAAPRAAAAERKAAGRRAPVAWLAGLAVLAAAEAVVIVALMMSRPASIVADSGSLPTKPVAQADQSASAPPATHLTPANTSPAPGTTPATPSSTSAPNPAPPAPAPAPTAASAAPAERFGGIRVSSPVALQVFEGSTLLGSTQSPIALLEGPHKIDLVNDALEFRVHTTAVVKPGQMTPLAIQLPNGRLSINALPWADVMIDGKPAGQTPLANLTVTIGEHEIIFHNPQFPDQKQTTVVKAETPTRVSVTFSK